MTKAKCEETKSRLVGWAKKGGALRRRLAYVMLSLVLIYYHSIGKRLPENRKTSAGKRNKPAKHGTLHRTGALHRIIQAVNLGVIIICLFLIAHEYYQTIQHRSGQKKLKAVFESAENIISTDMVLHPKSDALDDLTPKPAMYENLQKLYEENNDLAAWISIEGTDIDYPVMQCEDDEYYLHHDFYGNEDKYGCLYIRNRANINDSDNFIIYGHNMQDGTMLGSLDSYTEESFYLEHPLISFYTLSDEYTYEIIAVFLSQVYNEDDDTFKYYQFYEADTEEDFD
ncbi:MAG: class B sortase, partial [Ruminococcus flavefaciens]|nr:class B sortase [Ruminococcus flavefaciens]